MFEPPHPPLLFPLHPSKYHPPTDSVRLPSFAHSYTIHYRFSLIFALLRALRYVRFGFHLPCPVPGRLLAILCHVDGIHVYFRGAGRFGGGRLFGGSIQVVSVDHDGRLCVRCFSNKLRHCCFTVFWFIFYLYLLAGCPSTSHPFFFFSLLSTLVFFSYLMFYLTLSPFPYLSAMPTSQCVVRCLCFLQLPDHFQHGCDNVDRMGAQSFYTFDSFSSGRCT
jgi:hypothetical protein